MQSNPDLIKSIESSLSIGESELEFVAEGKLSETFFVTIGGRKKVLRVTDEDESYRKDKYASELFAHTEVPVPTVSQLGQLNNGLFYAISDFYPGMSSDRLTNSEMQESLSGIWDIFSSIFNRPIEDTRGFGYADANSFNGESVSWRSHVLDYEESHSISEWKDMTIQAGLDPSIIDNFKAQLQNNIGSVPEIRQLIHGDLGFDNLLMNNGRVSAVIDWAQMGYGDWYYDFATMDFWQPGRYGDAKVFGEKYGFDTENLDERKAAYWARRAFGTLNFAINKKNDETLQWIKKNLDHRIINNTG